MAQDKPLILDVSEVLDLEKRIASSGTSLLELMQRAGIAIAEEIEARLDKSAKILMFAGYGNNGGDAWVAALKLAREGYRVTLISPVDPKNIKSEPARSAALNVLDGISSAYRDGEDGSLQICVQPDEIELAEMLDQSNVIVDGMLGTGFNGDELRDPFATWVSMVNEAKKRGKFCLAIDAPSGLSAQTGKAASPCFVADKTVTMLTGKKGLYVEEAKFYTGELVIAPLIDDVQRFFD